MNKMYETSSKRRGITSKKLLAFIAATIVAVAMMTASCGDNIVESGGQINPMATLNVVVRDATTGNLMDGAEVTLLTAPKGRVNNVARTVNGTATFRDVYVGTHRVQVELANYARAVYDADISRDISMSEDTYIANNNTVEIPLYPFSAGINGYLYYSKDGVSHPAAGAEVRFTLNEATGIEDRVFTTKVNSSGLYEFKGLPAAYGWLTALDFTTDGVTYINFNLGNVTLSADATEYVLNKREYVDKTVPFIWLGSGATNTVIGPKENIVLKFSDNIDADKIADQLVEFSPPQAATITHSADEIRITPFEEWFAPGGRFDVFINNNLISVKGTRLTGGTHVPVSVVRGELTLPAVKGLMIDTLKQPQSFNVPHFNSTVVDLKWESVEGATGYYVYYKKFGGNHYEKVGETTRKIDTTETVQINGWDPIEDNINEFVVQAYSERAVGTLDGVTPLQVFSRPTIKDGYRTQIANQSNLGFAGNTNDRYLGNWLNVALQGADVTSAIEYEIHFTEPMVQQANPNQATFLNAYEGYSRVAVETRWRNDTTMTLSFRVNAGTAVASQSIDAMLIISDLRSVSGRPFFVEYLQVEEPAGSQRRKVVKSTMDFRFRTP